MAKPLLNLDTLTERATVAIDGTPYALLPPDALSAVDYHRFRRLTPRLETLWNQETPLMPDEEKELEQILAALCSIVLEAPPDVHARLTDMQRLAVYQAFLKLPQNTLPHLTGSQKTTGRIRTGARSQPASRTHTAATRSPGLPARRSASSAPI